MKNVMQFQSTRTKEDRHMQGNQKSTALVVVEDLTEREALIMHTSVKERGRGAVKAFVENETPYESYPKYHYQLKKKGIMPMSKRKKSILPTKPLDHTHQLQLKIDQLERQLQVSKQTPAERAINILYSSYKEVGYKSRSFLCSIISKDRATLTDKQEKWLSDLEA